MFFWTNRQKLANQFLEAANAFDEKLRGNGTLNPTVVEALIRERDRILELFTRLAPEFQGRISVAATENAFAEELRVFVWKGRLYVLVSAALMGRAYDHPNDVGEKGWEWLALHELAHVRKGHLPWLFYTRMAVRLTNTALLGLMIPHCFGVGSIFFKGAYLAFLGSLVLQMVVSLKCEWDADLYATQLTHDPEVLQEAEKSLCRMRMQAMGTSLLKRIGYFINCLCVDPHPPWMIRRALLRKKA